MEKLVFREHGLLKTLDEILKEVEVLEEIEVLQVVVEHKLAMLSAWSEISCCPYASDMY